MPKKYEDDFMEDDIASYPLRVRLKIKEEEGFKLRCKKEQAAILEVKRIIEKCVRIHHEFLNKKTPSKDEVLNYFFNSDYLCKKTPQDRDKKYNFFIQTGTKAVIEDELKGLKSIYEKIDLNDPYVLESIYMTAYHLGDASTFNEGINDKLRFVNSIKKVLEPLLTEEFFLFFRKMRQPIEGERKNPSDLDLEVKSHSNSFRIVNEMIKDVRKMSKDVTHRLNRAQLKYGENLNDLWGVLNEVLTQTREVENETIKFLLEMFVYLKNSKKSDSLDLITLSFVAKARSSFSLLYQNLRQLEEINRFLDGFDKRPVSEENSVEDISSVCREIDVVPKLDDSFIEKPIIIQKNEDNTVQKHAITHAFIDQKKQQLSLWNECVKQRREQCLKEKLKPLYVAPSLELDEDMTLEQAKALLFVLSCMTADNATLFDSFFASDLSCKPHNISFKDVSLLIKNLGGELNQNGGSHFSIKLPNMFNLTQTLATVGGGYKPHGKEEWNRSAHNLFKHAFENAGITPNRIEMAKKIIIASKKSEMKNA